MAFVTRSDREITLSTLEPNKLGPGQYTTNSERTLKTEPHVSFNTIQKDNQILNQIVMVLQHMIQGKIY